MENVPKATLQSKSTHITIFRYQMKTIVKLRHHTANYSKSANYGFQQST